MESLSIILPTFNEAENISDLVLESVRYARIGGVRDIEVLVVDDNSPDGTSAVVEAMKPVGFSLRLIRRMKDRGLTNSLREGVEASSYDVVLWFDCDFSHPPKNIPQMISMIDRNYDVVVNSRYVPGGGETRVGEGGQLQLFMSRMFNWGMRLLLDPRFTDYTSGFIMVRKEVLRRFPLRGDYGEYFIELAYRILKSPYKLCELPFVAEPRRSGESKTGASLADFLGRGKKYIGTALSLRWRRILGRI